MYLREFLLEYRNLPLERFSPRADARDPVAVWELKRPNAFLFYLVNRERVPMSVDLHLSGKATVERLSTKEAVKTEDGLLHVALEPYQLLAFRAPAGVTIDSVKTIVPDAYKQQVGRQVEWLGKLAMDVKEQRLGQTMKPDLKTVLAALSAEASAAFHEGRFWRSRTILENHTLLQVYDSLLRFPPFLRDVKSPVVPTAAWRSDELIKMAKTADGPLRQEGSETISKWWTGDQVAVTAANRYRITLGHAAGGEYGLLECRIGGTLVGVATDDRTDPHGAATVFSELAMMTAGSNVIQLERKAGKQTALQFLDIKPVFRDIVAKEWSVIGPFASISELKLPGDGLAKVYPPEETRDFSAKVSGENGKMVSWEAMEGEGDYVDMFKKYRLFSSGIAYAVTYIYAPDARLTRFSVGLDYWGKIWLNGTLAKDFSTRGYAPAKGQFSFDAELKPGWSELLVKIHSGGSGNGFWMAVSDPGDLRFANQPGK
jgi:hypothetical protein